jgi:hypothetical protein
MTSLREFGRHLFCPRRATVCAWLVATTTLASACGQQSPTTPSNPPPIQTAPAPPPRTFVTLRLSGFVNDENNQPVAGATLTVNSNALQLQPSPVVTAGDGSYAVSVAIDTSYVAPGVTVLIRADGYEPTESVALFLGYKDSTTDFRLFRLQTIAAGEDGAVLFGLDGPWCGFELEFPCRHVNFVSTVPGTLEVDLVAGDPSVAFSFGPVTYPLVIRTHQTLQMRAGQVVALELLFAKGLLTRPPAVGSVRVKTALTP